MHILTWRRQLDMLAGRRDAAGVELVDRREDSGVSASMSMPSARNAARMRSPMSASP